MGIVSISFRLSYLPIVRKRLGGKSNIKLISIIAFPFGFIPSFNKRKESEYAIEQGAEELDLVPNYFALKEENFELFAEEINQICELGIPVRVIIDATILLNPSTLSMAINSLIDAGAIGIQIGNGFGPPISKNQTNNVSKIVKNRCSIKTVGGIKTFDQAIELIEAGSTYIGTSFGFEIKQEQKKKE